MASHHWTENPALAPIVAEIASAHRIISLLSDSHDRETVEHYIQALLEEGRKIDRLTSDQT